MVVFLWHVKPKKQQEWAHQAKRYYENYLTSLHFFLKMYLQSVEALMISLHKAMIGAAIVK